MSPKIQYPEYSPLSCTPDSQEEKAACCGHKDIRTSTLGMAVTIYMMDKGFYVVIGVFVVCCVKAPTFIISCLSYNQRPPTFVSESLVRASMCALGFPESSVIFSARPSLQYSQTGRARGGTSGGESRTNGVGGRGGDTVVV